MSHIIATSVCYESRWLEWHQQSNAGINNSKPQTKCSVGLFNVVYTRAQVEEWSDTGHQIKLGPMGSLKSKLEGHRRKYQFPCDIMGSFTV